MKTNIKCRKDLCADSMFNSIYSNFDKITDHRENKPIVSLADALMSGFAMFSLKEPSLYNVKNGLFAIYGR